MVRQKKLVDQLPMEFMLPDVKWTVPESLPDWRGRDFALDCETKDDGLANESGPGWATGQGYITGVSMSDGVTNLYVPVRHPDSPNFDRDQVVSWVRGHMHQRAQVHKYFQNAPYDLGWLWADFGIEPPQEVDDTLAMAFMLDENELTYNLDSICRRLGIPGKDEAELKSAAEAFGLHPKKELWKLPARFVGPYAAQDAGSTFHAAEKMLGMLDANNLMPAYRLEADLIPMVLRMRKKGVRINTEQALRTQKTLLAKRDEALRQLSERAAIGRPWHIDDVRSPKFLEQKFDQLNQHTSPENRIAIPRTEKGNLSFASEWMSKHEHWLPSLSARALKMHDAADKFLGKYILGHTHMGRIHAEIHQFKGEDGGGTRTYRFAYSNPPLQQMPSRDDEIAAHIRSCFEPEPGHIWAAVDYSQQEYRLMVHFANLCKIEGAEVPAKMYRDDPNTDFHDMVAEITGLIRRKAKDVNFAKAFGAGPGKFSEMVGCTIEEAKAQMSEYDREMPWLKRFSEYCQNIVDQRGYIRLIDGARGRFDRWEPRWLDHEKRKIYVERCKQEGVSPRLEACDRDEAYARLRDPKHPWSGNIRRAFTHKSMNTLIQGSAARQMKMAMREVYRAGILPDLQMHDELDLSVESRETADKVAEIMRDVVKLVIPVKVDVEFGVNWGRAAKDKKTGHMATWEEAVAERASA